MLKIEDEQALDAKIAIVATPDKISDKSYDSIC